VLLKGDDAGHINQLGRIDAAVTTPTGSHEITITPPELAGGGQTGQILEGLGNWYSPIDDVLYLYLNLIFQYLMLNATVHIEEITVYINSTANAGGIINTVFEWFSNITGASVDSVTDPTDIGIGSTGNTNGTITVNTDLIVGHWYRLQYDCLADGGGITVRAITVKYTLT